MATPRNWTKTGPALAGLVLLLAACGGGAPAPSTATSGAVSSPAGKAAGSAPPAASAAAPESAKPAASASAKPAGSAEAKPAGSAEAKPAGSAAAKPAESGAVGPQVSSQAIPAAKPGTINLALVGGSPSATPIYVALESKLFEKYNAPIQLIIMTAPPAMAALISGDVQVAMDGGALVSADVTAQKLAFVGALQNGFNQFVMYVKPSINSLADLKGKTIAVGTPASAATITAELMAKSAGVDKNDIKWIYAGTPAAEWAALQQGQVDGATLVWPFDMQARAANFKLLADGKQMKLAGASLNMGVQREWAKNNGPVLQNFLKAVTEAAYLANTDKEKAESAVSKRLNVTDQAQLDEAFNRFAGTYPVPPYITKEAVEEAIRDDPNPGNKQRKPEDFIENGPLDALVASGFTKQFEK